VNRSSCHRTRSFAPWPCLFAPCSRSDRTMLDFLPVSTSKTQTASNQALLSADRYHRKQVGQSIRGQCRLTTLGRLRRCVCARAHQRAHRALAACATGGHERVRAVQIDPRLPFRPTQTPRTVTTQRAQRRSARLWSRSVNLSGVHSPSGFRVRDGGIQARERPVEVLPLRVSRVQLAGRNQAVRWHCPQPGSWGVPAGVGATNRMMSAT
jgi:hypothetical protein